MKKKKKSIVRKEKEAKTINIILKIVIILLAIAYFVWLIIRVVPGYDRWIGTPSQWL